MIQCTGCDAILEESDWNEHLQKEHNWCNECGKFFPDKYNLGLDLWEHAQANAKKTAPDLIEIQCTGCGAILKKSDWHEHLQKEHNWCNECGKFFPDKYNLGLDLWEHAQANAKKPGPDQEAPLVWRLAPEVNPFYLPFLENKSNPSSSSTSQSTPTPSRPTTQQKKSNPSSRPTTQQKKDIATFYQNATDEIFTIPAGIEQPNDIATMTGEDVDDALSGVHTYIHAVPANYVVNLMQSEQLQVPDHFLTQIHNFYTTPPGRPGDYPPSSLDGVYDQGMPIESDTIVQDRPANDQTFFPDQYSGSFDSATSEPNPSSWVYGLGFE